MRPRSVAFGSGALGGPEPEPELGRPGHPALVGVLPVGGGGPDPGAGPLVLVADPVLPRHPPGPAVVVDQQLGLGVDGVTAVGEGELEQLGLGDGLGRAGLDAEVAVDAAQVVDLVDEPVALPRRNRGVGRVVGTADVDALGGADTGAQLAADALLHPVLVAVEDVPAVEAGGLGPLGLRVLGGDPGPEQRLAEGDGEPAPFTHWAPPSGPGRPPRPARPPPAGSASTTRGSRRRQTRRGARQGTPTPASSCPAPPGRSPTRPATGCR